MMNNISKILASACLGCITIPGMSQTIVKVGNSEVSVDEFERIYKKNNTQLSNSEDQMSPKEYMELFINFKLKVLAAESEGLDTVQSFVNELNQYRTELAEPYLNDVDYSDSLVVDLYQRTLHQVRASHILINLDENASPEDTLKVYHKMIELREKIIRNELTFADAAKSESECPSSAKFGDLGFFGAFQMVVPFENAAYNTPIGEVSMPVRTRFGYHLIYVTDQRKNDGEVKVAHIMKSFKSEKPSNAQIQSAKHEIDSLYKLLNNGANFETLAQENSDDKQSATRGGEMPWLSRGKIIPEFENVAFSLENNGDISSVFKTQYGYHIIKKVESRSPKSFEEMKSSIEAKIKRDPLRSRYSIDHFVQTRKNEYHYSENQLIIDELDKISQSMKGDWKDTASWNADQLKKTLFVADEKEYHFGEMLLKIPEIKDINTKKFRQALNRYTEYSIIDIEDSHLEEKYPDFRYLMNEYHDGILLFTIMEDKIWNRASNDTIGLEGYYEDNIGKYSYGEHYDGAILSYQTESMKDSINSLLESGIKIEDLSEYFPSEEFSVKTGKWEEGGNEIVDFYIFEGSKPDVLKNKNIFVVGERKQNGEKTLKDARGLYISDYQTSLEEDWIEELRKTYKVKINKKSLKKVESVL